MSESVFCLTYLIKSKFANRLGTFFGQTGQQFYSSPPRVCNGIDLILPWQGYRLRVILLIAEFGVGLG